ncbi:Histidine kinase [Raineyella antarctica]|uniref:Oxygen sensor histidine kinase NreB n=2 Tax=Raineyella antarctica TaxID=1577474 RepID=A0A1G6HF76_9ACTN|nr:Histidine kinase [Raineyella antarctica]
MLACGAVCTAVVPAAGIAAGRIFPALLPVPNALAYLGVAGYAAWKRPDHRAAQRMVLWAVTMAAGYGAGAAYSAWVIGTGRTDWGWAGLLALQMLSWLGALALVALFLVFPDGTYRRPFDRGVVRGALVALLVLALCQVLGSQRISTGDLVWSDSAQATNPWALPALSWLGIVGAIGLGPGGALLTVLGAVLLLLRWRASGPQDRRRIAWPLLGIAATAVASLVLGGLHALLPPWPDWLQVVAWGPVILLVPVTLLLGMATGDLLDIRLVVRRSLLYGSLWLLITLAFVGITALAGAVAGSRTPLAMVIATTVLVGFVAAPARRRLEDLADRLVFGRRVERDRLLGEVGRRLAAASGVEDALPAVAEAVRQGLRASWVDVRLEGHGTAMAGSPTPTPAEAVPALVVPIEVDGVESGRIRCGPKLDGRYGDRDELLLETLGRQAVWAARYANLSRELSAKVAELEASRTRILRAEEIGRQRLERDLHDGVQQELVGLLTRLGLASHQLRRDPALAAATLTEAHADAREALEDLQELVHGIHPALLTDRGLVAAVEERAARMSIPVVVRSDTQTRTQRLPAAIETGAYFVVSECLTNVAKHAPTASATVAFATHQGSLRVVVSDDGPGFEARAPLGTGLGGLQDRVDALGGSLVVHSVPGGGTTITADIPTDRSTP